MDSSFQNISTAGPSQLRRRDNLLRVPGRFRLFFIINYVILETEKEAKDAIL